MRSNASEDTALYFLAKKTWTKQWKETKIWAFKQLINLNKFMTDVIFVQVIFSRLRASSNNFENKEKDNMNLPFLEV